MATKLTIKQIAALSGVSAGTVDRVLHNRGLVSKKAQDAVNAVLESNAYNYNLHTSAIAFKKTKKIFDIVIAIPFSDEGEYWDLIKKGIESGFNEYIDIPTNVKFIHFDQFNASSCQSAFDKVSAEDCSAVILGTTYDEEVKALCKTLDSKGTPYVFVDGKVSDTHPKATFMANQSSCGRLLAKLMYKMTPPGSEIAVMLPRRVASSLSNNSKIRLEAFKAFFKEHNAEDRLKTAYYSANDKHRREKEILDFLSSNPLAKGIAAVISTSYMISDAIAESNRSSVCIGGFDVTRGNARCIKAETIDFVIDQHPMEQGTKAVEATLQYLLYGTVNQLTGKYIPVNVVFKENL